MAPPASYGVSQTGSKSVSRRCTCPKVSATIHPMWACTVSSRVITSSVPANGTSTCTVLSPYSARGVAWSGPEVSTVRWTRPLSRSRTNIPACRELPVRS